MIKNVAYHTDRRIEAIQSAFKVWFRYPGTSWQNREMRAQAWRAICKLLRDLLLIAAGRTETARRLREGQCEMIDVARLK